MSKIENLNAYGQKYVNLFGGNIYIIKELKELLDRDHELCVDYVATLLIMV
jgi:hypothetical protein